MKMRDLFLATIAAMAVVLCPADASMAQQKRQPQAVLAAFKECCDRAYSSVFQWNGQLTCRIMQSRLQDAFHQCIHEKGIRLSSSGQFTR